MYMQKDWLICAQLETSSRSHLVLELGENKFVMQDICFMGGDGHFRYQWVNILILRYSLLTWLKTGKYIDLHHDTCYFSRIIIVRRLENRNKKKCKR